MNSLKLETFFKFVSIHLVLVLLFTFCILVPSLVNLLIQNGVLLPSSYGEFELLQRLSGIGDRKSLLLVVLFLFIHFSAIILSLQKKFLEIPNKIRVVIFLVFFISNVSMLTMSYFVKNSRSVGTSFSNVEFREYSDPTILENIKFNKKMNTFDDFYSSVESYYDRYSAVLKKYWKIENEMMIKSIFFMKIVSSLWAYGDEDPKAPGCVLSNLSQSINEEDVNIQTYLKAKIGCCKDYAYLLKFLLDKAQIKNRLVHIPGHIFNEIKISNQWRYIDANLNFWGNSSWNEMINRESERRIVLNSLQHESLKYPGKFYRNHLGSFKQFVIYILSMRDRVYQVNLTTENIENVSKIKFQDK